MTTPAWGDTVCDVFGSISGRLTSPGAARAGAQRPPPAGLPGQLSSHTSSFAAPVGCRMAEAPPECRAAGACPATVHHLSQALNASMLSAYQTTASGIRMSCIQGAFDLAQGAGIVARVTQALGMQQACLMSSGRPRDADKEQRLQCGTQRLASSATRCGRPCSGSGSSGLGLRRAGSGDCRNDTCRHRQVLQPSLLLPSAMAGGTAFAAMGASHSDMKQLCRRMRQHVHFPAAMHQRQKAVGQVSTIP